MSEEIAESQPPSLLRGTARQAALADWKLQLGALMGVAIAGIKATLEWGWLGPVSTLGLCVITLSVIAGGRKLSAVRLRAAFGEPSAFAVEFHPLGLADYRRLGAKEWRRRTYRALLAIDRVRLTFRTDESGRSKGWNDFSVPLADIRKIVVRRPRGRRPGAMAFVELEGGGVFHFTVLDRGATLVAALEAAGVTRLEED